MTFSKSIMLAHGPSNASTVDPNERWPASEIELSVAATLSDFMQVTPLMRRVATESCAPVESNRIGSMLARMNHGGSGPDTGCVVLARLDQRLVGFAVLLLKPDTGLELLWLHAGDEKTALVTERLWEKVLQIKSEWHFRVVHVGIFAEMPIAMLETIANR